MSNLILRPIKKSSLKLKKRKMVFMQEFRGKRMMGHEFRCRGLKIKSNEDESAQKKCSFLDYFFFNGSLKLVHLQLCTCWVKHLVDEIIDYWL